MLGAICLEEVEEGVFRFPHRFVKRYEAHARALGLQLVRRHEGLQAAACTIGLERVATIQRLVGMASIRGQLIEHVARKKASLQLHHTSALPIR